MAVDERDRTPTHHDGLPEVGAGSTEAVRALPGDLACTDVRRARLTVLEGAAAGTSCVIEGEHGTIGSDPRNAMVIEDPTVSRFQSEINVEPEGARGRGAAHGSCERAALGQPGEAARRSRAQVDGEISSGRATGARLEHEIGRRRITAPIAGRLGSVQTLQVGMVLREGDRLLGKVRPTGDIKVVADFSPEQALGKVRPGQRARLRLDGFAWTEYGSLPAVVTTVASEARFGRVRVELRPEPAPGSRIPLQHGLPGALEVVVEEVAPATLALRAVGEATTRP